MKFELNKELDKEVYLAFHDVVVGGADFGKKIKETHPQITKENYIEYIESFYVTHEEDLLKVLAETQKCYVDIEKTLFSQLFDLFHFDYSGEKYICYLSIFNCNPRYLETKSFQVFYKKSRDMRKEVIAHELTHFAFYDFCYRLGIKDSKELWELSEIFNVIFLNLQPVRDTIGSEELLFYPDLKEKLGAIKVIWQKRLSTKEFILESLGCLKKAV